ncbi:hypothetical protein SELMODRAFT_233921 [Selaginella moellendorffii]|uniref:Aldehyde dehydrogenase domain-containing protein n=1 Tax=Selaginella moellendorffii TaxID=88036 RepID=D8SFR7_SELML|nr:aldehyde dehydrogenase family 2 member B7, mitochondrial [Selaginella moellendorffii]EFJ16774.1 hypothetical protein SELMODRAFT_233921 [Selaginella moellendorffii]|eukprot:XP_002982106.1 aldehyde dehydrogenase family 2 member B7, mitochondrial [Selaginella moellendorffii]
MDFLSRDKLKETIEHTQLFIDGQFVDSASGKKFAAFDPSTGETIADVAEGDERDVDLAVQAARKAFEEGPWPRLAGAKRGKILAKLADLMEAKIMDLSTLETLNNGMPLQATMFMTNAAIDVLRYYGGWADKIAGKTLKGDGDVHAYTLYEPIGVVGAIVPWNFPVYLLVCKIAPALVCGNTMVVKPSEQAPLTALWIAKLALEAGVPAGVLNIVPGFGPTAGAAIARHMDIDKLTFTGSTNVGRLVMNDAASSNLKQVTLELGGKSPFIICEDANLEVAAFFSHLAIFFHQGQVCLAGSRVFVHESVYDAFVEKAVAMAKRRVIGDPLKIEVEHGPQINQAQADKILSYIESAHAEGARLVTGGKRIGDKGFYIEPTIFADVTQSMTIAKEEIFGPVLSVLKFKTLDEAVKLANSTSYGLAAAIFAKDIDTVNFLSRSIKSGIVFVNSYFSAGPGIPFGGYKMSGIGRENGYEGLLPYLQTKSVVMPLANSPWL